jgi:hypothetical protein
MQRASLVVVLLLLASVGTASAECAWVLWRGTVAPGELRWTIGEAFPAAADCTTALTFAAESMTSSGIEVLHVPGTRMATWRDGVGRGYLYCLPDTIDPRGPKGDRR